MQFSLRTLVLVTAIVPALVGYVAMSIRRKYDGSLIVEWPDPLLVFGIICWVGIWAHFIYGRTPSTKDAQPDA